MVFFQFTVLRTAKKVSAAAMPFGLFSPAESGSILKLMSYF
jgi:hypothetical protein